MKKILCCLALAAAFAGCATKDAYDIKPEAAADGVPTSVEWQNAHNADLEAAMTPQALSAYVRTSAAADALLAEVKTAYATDPMVATRIGAITQLVMCQTCKKAPACRKVWAAALLRAAEGSTDAYRTMFFLDQLRWCGFVEQKAGVLAIKEKSSEKCVKDFAAWVVRELK